MVAALYSSRINGTKTFTKHGVNFGWKAIEDLYDRELQRAKRNEPMRVPRLKKRHVIRDAWTRLNVAPAKTMQVTKCTGKSAMLSLV